MLTQTLAQLIPAHLPPVLVVDSERHWMLMRDAGTTLEKISEYDPNIDRWEEALRLYAQMQIDLAAHTGELKACGCPDMSLDRLPELFEEALAATPLLLLGQPGGLPEGEYEQLRTFTPQLKTMCATLKKYAVPESLHHDDFHASNIMHNGKTYIFFDWAECGLTHPFCSMVIVERYAKYVLEYDDEKLDRLCEAYLVPWTCYETRERLREACVLAQRLGKLCRALTWRRLVSDIEPDARREYETAFPHWLRLFLGTAED